jgi:hypothetical protein
MSPIFTPQHLNVSPEQKPSNQKPEHYAYSFQNAHLGQERLIKLIIAL